MCGSTLLLPISLPERYPPSRLARAHSLFHHPPVTTLYPRLRRPLPAQSTSDSEDDNGLVPQSSTPAFASFKCTKCYRDRLVEVARFCLKRRGCIVLDPEGSRHNGRTVQTTQCILDGIERLVTRLVLAVILDGCAFLVKLSKPILFNNLLGRSTN
jgi:hypothetical protein